MPRNRAADLHLRVPQYSLDCDPSLRTPSIASSASYTHRPQPARTTSSASMLSSDGDDAMESDWGQAQEDRLLTVYNAEVISYSHQNPPFVASAPPPALLSRVAKRVIRQEGRSWPHTLAQTRKRLLLLVRRHAPEPASPHVAPQQPAVNRMSAITNDLPGYFNQQRGLNSPFDERSFDFDTPVTPKKRSSTRTKEPSPGFGVPLTPKAGNRRTNTRLKDVDEDTPEPQESPRRSSRIRDGRR
ncbi:Transcription factor iws1 [Savitreella phatthalungensis]